MFISSLLAFIASPLGKIAGYIIAGLSAIGIIMAVLHYHDNQVKELAQYQYNQIQLEQTVKDQQNEIVKLQQLNDTRNQIIDDLDKKNKDLLSKTNDIDNYLNNTKSTDPVSPVILETLKKMKGLQ